MSMVSFVACQGGEVSVWIVPVGLMLDLKTLMYTSLNSLLFLFFASFLVEVLLLRGMNLKLGSLSLREISAWSLGTPFIFCSMSMMYLACIVGRKKWSSWYPSFVAG